MKVIRYVQVALESIAAHKLRAMLTMLGIIIGVAAVLTTMGIGRGAAANITERIQSQGTNLLTISPSARSVGGLSQGGGTAGTLTMGDVKALQNKSLHPDLVYVVPSYSANARLAAGNQNAQETVNGVTAEYVQVRNLTVASGRFIEADEVVQQARVVVLGAQLASDLFGNENPIGLLVRINGEPFQVIGVLKKVGGFGPNNPDRQAYVPISIAQGRLFNAARHRGEYTVSSVYVQVASEALMDTAQRQIEATLRLRHNLRADQDNDFWIFNQASLLETAQSISQTMTVFLGAIGAVSLLVGGIGIMNIMLVSVTERTREIGLRKAVGAHDSDILLQFLIEALVLCLVGGVIGVVLAYGVAFGFGQMPAVGFKVVIQPDSLVLALSFSLLSGLIFGIYPAMRATQLDPIVALRSE